MQWDLFCRVVDHHGDIGVCWRLAADLAARGEAVRLWVDDASALAWMAPGGAPSVEVRAWPLADSPIEPPGDVVVEAFGCELPSPFVRRMALAARPPVWINLEYLSAEDFVERAHGLPSPQAVGPGAGLRKWFFYPGFTARTGGLLREADLLARRHSFDAPAWLRTRGVEMEPHQQIVSLLCYENAALPALLARLARQPTWLLAAAGLASRQVSTLLGPSLTRGELRAVLLPWLSQRDYDHLLWASDLNFVRGEDSFVRAQWAAKPFVWQIYAQDDGAHTAKLDAYLARFLQGAAPGLATAIDAQWQHWNATVPVQANPPEWPARDPWQAHCESWRTALVAQCALTDGLIGFAAERR